jgi:cupin 2 domain-containing protein
MTIAIENIFAAAAGHAPNEQISTLLATTHMRLERIVSHAHASPEGKWYDQDWDEWVIVLKGSAGLLFEGESTPRVLGPGDYLVIPAHLRHRVAWTDAGEPTVWLAVHYR